uniref:Uncharacterized protein n=1 Tax=Anguilla anguilla TaxID=7936 RepID=A0A0E9TM72_ANGAN
MKMCFILITFAWCSVLCCFCERKYVLCKCFRFPQ